MNLHLTLDQFCALLGIPLPEHLVDFKEVIIERIASLEKAEETDATVIFSRGDASVFTSIDLEKIRASRARIILAADAHLLNDSTIRYKVLLVPEINTKLTDLQNTLAERYKASSPASSIDPTARVHHSAIIGQGSKIGAGAIIHAGVVIGDQVSIGAHSELKPLVAVGDYCQIGKHCLIQAGTVIGSDGFGFSVTRQGLSKLPHLGIVRIGNNVELGAQCAVDRALLDQTIIHDGVKCDNLVHIAHNVEIGAHTAILAQTGIAGSVRIGTGCQIGGQVAIKDHVIIGNQVKIVSKSAVINNLADGVTVAGQPAQPFMQWKRQTAALSALPELLKKIGSENRFFPAKKSFFASIKNWLKLSFL